MDRSGSADRHIPRSSGAERTHVKTESCHVRHHPLMGTADVNRCGLVCDHSSDYQLFVIVDLKINAVSDGRGFKSQG
jgi:hypothetical protein